MLRNLMVMLLVVTFSSQAELKRQDLAKAESQLKATFSNYSFNSIEPSPIAGFVEVHTATGVVYFSAEQKLLIFGKVFNSVGENLTEKSLRRTTVKLIDRLPISDAVVVGDPEGVEIIEFTNPDCGYCQRFEDWLPTLTTSTKIKRNIFFMDNAGMPDGRKKFEHIICSEDKNLAHKQVYKNQLKEGEYKTCEEASKVISSHQKAVKMMAVQGTPSFVINGSFITGFNKESITKALLNEALNNK